LTERVRVQGIEVAYEDLGAGPGPPFVLVHGFTGHRDDFREVSEALAEDRRVLIPDLRGHGDSGRGEPDEYTFDSLVAELAGWLDLLGIPSCDLLGHSMGGMLALRFALAHPTRVASLVLMNTAATPPAGMEPDTMDRPGAIALEHGMADLQMRVERASRTTPDPILERWADQYWAHHRRRYLDMDPAAYAGLGRAMAAQQPLTERLREIRCRTLVLVGDHDHDFLPASKALASGIPGAVFELIPEAGHHPQFENRDAWLAAIRSHLRPGG
jgi:2-succinyl-6-hydroxy-2,4-cyclohexadiene-1-carboxylate synthase